MRYSHTALSVKSIEVSQKFYTTVFGFEFKSRGDRKELLTHFVYLEDKQGNGLELFEHDSPLPLVEKLMDFRKIGIKHIAFVVDSIEPILERAKKNGASALLEPRKGITVKRIAFISDPDGIPIELVEV